MIKKTSKNITTDSEQFSRFIKTARELGYEDDEAAFEDKLKRLVKPNPKQQ